MTYYQKRYKKYRENYLKHARKFRRRTKMIILEHYGGNPPRCACCGESHIEFLTIDHINNDGAKHRKEMHLGSGYQFYRWLIKNDFPEGYQILCFNCNCSKTHFGECPHEREK